MGKTYTASEISTFFDKHQVKFSDFQNKSIAAEMVAHALNDPLYTDSARMDRLGQVMRLGAREVRDFINDVSGKSASFSLSQTFTNASSKLGKIVENGLKDLVYDLIDSAVPLRCGEVQHEMERGQNVTGNSPIRAIRAYACGPKMPEI